MKIGIDLLWVRPNICGGTESFVRNLMNGFGMYDEKNNYLLFVGKDNAETFNEYTKYLNFEIAVCNVNSHQRIKRIAWENTKLDRIAVKKQVDIMFIPVYSKPHSRSRIPYVTVIHDLQALHYPKYFSTMKRVFTSYEWKKSCKESKRIVTISEYCRKDIVDHYAIAENKINVVYNPIVMSDVSIDFEKITDKYGVKPNHYYYVVSSMLPHKNLITIIKVMAKLKEHNDKEKLKLVVSGVGGNKEEFSRQIQKYNVEDLVVDTGFVSNEERNALYANCKLFLFPSMFEGFGMPPIEAMMMGATVLTTRCASLGEVTKGLAKYVENPMDENEWYEKIVSLYSYVNDKKEQFEEYRLEAAVKGYLEIFDKIAVE